jgi:small subunit ribosomal protein S1
MSNENFDPAVPFEEPPKEQSDFGDILSSFEREHPEGKGEESVSGIIVSVRPDGVLIDVGRKIEGFLPLTRWLETQEGDPQVGSNIMVSVGPRNEEGFYELSTVKVERPKDWSGLQTAFNEKRNIAGFVAEQVKGGFRVDIGVRAFMPASRSGVREMADMPLLVGQEIQCRITKLDVDKEDVVVDRRIVLEEEQSRRKEQAFGDLKEGSVLRGRVRSVMDFGAFLDVGGVDGLLHITDMAYNRVAKASDMVKVGDELEVKLLKVDPTTHKVSLGLKQLQEDPWSVAARTLHVGDRVSGTVSRLTDFGAFVELLPGVDGLVHISELSWNKRVRKPGDLLKIGERIEAVVLQFNPAERRIGLGYKQALGDPWEKISEKFPVGATIEGTVTNITQFGGFIELGEGIEGMVHISDITNEKRLDHVRQALTKGQRVKALVLEVDKEKRRLRVGMKQLEPTTVDHYISEHQAGQTVSGRLVEVQGDRARVELGEGIIANCKLKAAGDTASTPEAPKSSDVGSLGAMLAARWKQGATNEKTKPPAKAGEVRSFRISTLDPANRLIELELAS